MPYIPPQARSEINVRVDRDMETPGELNYAITRLITLYLGPDLNYGLINDVLGALEGAKLEFYRRVAVGYEEEKREANNDVYRVR